MKFFRKLLESPYDDIEMSDDIKTKRLKKIFTTITFICRLVYLTDVVLLIPEFSIHYLERFIVYESILVFITIDYSMHYFEKIMPIVGSFICIFFCILEGF
jgi:hypothetical protein